MPRHIHPRPPARIGLDRRQRGHNHERCQSDVIILVLLLAGEVVVVVVPVAVVVLGVVIVGVWRGEDWIFCLTAVIR